MPTGVRKQNILAITAGGLLVAAGIFIFGVKMQCNHPHPTRAMGAGSGSGAVTSTSLEVVADGDIKIVTGPESAVGSGSGE